VTQPPASPRRPRPALPAVPAAVVQARVLLRVYSVLDLRVEQTVVVDPRPQTEAVEQSLRAERDPR
jgi:hypothetical protein